MSGYYENDAVSASLLKTVTLQSAAHADYRRKNPVRPTKAMKLGTAAHAAILDDFDSLIAVEPGFDKRSKKGKEEYERWAVGLNGKTIITPEQAELVAGMQAATEAHPIANDLLNQCYATEVEVFFDIDGLACKSKFDAMNGEEGLIVDLKTTQDASPKAFARQSANLLYHLQMAFYEQASQIDDLDMIVIAVENKPPHGVAVYRYGPEVLMQGAVMFSEAIDKWKEYQAEDASSVVQHYGVDIHDMKLPAWAIIQDMKETTI